MVEPSGDLRVGEPVTKEHQHLHLALGQQPRGARSRTTAAEAAQQRCRRVGIPPCPQPSALVERQPRLVGGRRRRVARHGAGEAKPRPSRLERQLQDGEPFDRGLQMRTERRDPRAQARSGRRRTSTTRTPPGAPRSDNRASSAHASSAATRSSRARSMSTSRPSIGAHAGSSGPTLSRHSVASSCARSSSRRPSAAAARQRRAVGCHSEPSSSRSASSNRPCRSRRSARRTTGNVRSIR